MLIVIVPEIKSSLKKSKTGRSRGHFYHRNRQYLKKDRFDKVQKNFLFRP